MIDFIRQHLGSIVVGFVILAIATAIVISRIRARRRPGCGCGGCSGCPSQGICHTEHESAH